MLIKKAVSQWVVIFSFASLLFIWPVLGTIALRYLLLIAGAIASVYLIVDHSKNLKLNFAGPLLPVFGLFVWILAHFLIFSSDHDAQLRELTGFWLRCFLSSIIGVGLGLVLWQSSFIVKAQNQVANGLLLGLSGTLLIYLFRYAYEIFLTSQMIHLNFFMTPFGGKPPIIIFVLKFMAGLFA